MFNEIEIKELVELQISKYHKFGDQAGGSGHMSFVSYQINSIINQHTPDGLLEISYEYTVFVETEFTYYPDNPPSESHHRKTILVDSEKNIIKP